MRAGAPPFATPRAIWVPLVATLLTTCEAEVCLKALARTHHAWQVWLIPVARTPMTRSARIQACGELIVDAMTEGKSTQTARTSPVMKTVASPETTKSPKASSFFFGSMMARLKSIVMPAPITIRSAVNSPKTPNSAGVNRRLMTGERA